MSFCDFFPDDPSCAAAEEEVVDEVVVDEEVVDDGGEDNTDVVDDGEDMGDEEPMDGGDEEPMEDGDWDDEGAMMKPGMNLQSAEFVEEFTKRMWRSQLAMADPMGANIMWLVMAGVTALGAGLHSFRWKGPDGTVWSDDTGKITESSTDYAHLSHQIADYGTLGIFSVAFVTQLLSMFGIAVGVNLMVWEYLVEGVGMVIELVHVVLVMLAWEDVHSYTDSAVTADKKRAAALWSELFVESNQGHVAEIAGALMAAATYEEWMLGQWNMLPMEDKAAQMEELALAVEEKEKEMIEAAKEKMAAMPKDE